MPLTSTSAIFSVPTGVLPVQPTLKNFILVFLGLSLLLSLVLAIILEWSWYIKILGWLGYRRTGPGIHEQEMGRYVTRMDRIIHRDDYPFSDDIRLDDLITTASMSNRRLV